MIAVVVDAVEEGVELEVVVTILWSTQSSAAGTTKAGVAGDELSVRSVTVGTVKAGVAKAAGESGRIVWLAITSSNTEDEGMIDAAAFGGGRPGGGLKLR